MNNTMLLDRVLNKFHSFLVLIILLILTVFNYACDSPAPYADFGTWYQSKQFKLAANTTSSIQSKQLVLQSKSLLIDTIFRSMQGPYDISDFEFNDKNEELVWITGYRSKILDSENGKEVSTGFMCHNNLDIKDKASFPWIIKTQGTSIRLFTLSEGQTSIQFPTGFGIPIPVGQKLSMFSQVLNHNVMDINEKVKHHVTLEYNNQSDLTFPFKPLYSQIIFITKKIEEAPGYQNYPRCGINLDSNATYNPYLDEWGNTYTGHWKIPFGREELTTNVSRMMDLSFDTKIHFIGVHLHPFAVSLRLNDITTDSVLYEARIENHSHKIGINNIPYYSSKEGIPVYKNHEYELVSTYYNRDSINEHTAMATMLLYLEDR